MESSQVAGDKTGCGVCPCLGPWELFLAVGLAHIVPPAGCPVVDGPGFGAGSALTLLW